MRPRVRICFTLRHCRCDHPPPGPGCSGPRPEHQSAKVRSGGHGFPPSRGSCFFLLVRFRRVRSSDSASGFLANHCLACNCSMTRISARSRASPPVCSNKLFALLEDENKVVESDQRRTTGFDLTLRCLDQGIPKDVVFVGGVEPAPEAPVVLRLDVARLVGLLERG